MDEFVNQLGFKCDFDYNDKSLYFRSIKGHVLKSDTRMKNKNEGGLWLSILVMI